MQEEGDSDEEESAKELLPAERDDLILQLKEKWDSVYEKYQKLTHVVKLDTVGKVKRKEQLEAQLEQIENDIQKIEKTKILIIDDDTC